VTYRSAVAPRAAETWRPPAPDRRGGSLRAATGALLVVLALGLAALVATTSAPERQAGRIRTAAGARPGAEPAARAIDATPAAAVKPAPRPVEGVLLTHAASEAAEQAEAAAAAAYAEKMRPKTGVDWDGVAQCETGGNWQMSGPTYSGGLGFANTTWSGFGGGEFAGNAGSASREEQIVVAERVYAEYGLSGWGCKRYG
jgi:hypothetical protein